MSDELKIELQVETNTEKAKSQLDNLIDEFKNRKPIDLQINIGSTNLETFKNSIKSITNDLTALSSIDFSNLKRVESNLLSISNLVKNFQDLNKNNSSTGSSTKSNPISDIAHEFDGSATFERLSKNNKEALKEIERMQLEAESIKGAFKQYNISLKEAYEGFEKDNADLKSTIEEIEGYHDSKVFKNLVNYRKELSDIIREYNSLDVKLENNDKVFESWNGDIWTAKNEKYVAKTEMSLSRFEEQVARAKELNAAKNAKLRNIQNNLFKNKKTATDEERKTFEMLDKVYRELEDNAKNFVATKPEMLKEYISGSFSSLFELDFTDLDMNFDDDLRKAYDRFFVILKEVQDEYNAKFKNEEGFKEINIFDPDTFKNDNKELEKEVDKTVSIVNSLESIDESLLEKLGINTNIIDTFNILKNAIDDVEGRLGSLKDKFTNAFEISPDAAASLDKIKDALIEINKLTEEQKQVLFDFNLDTDKINKVKEETKELNSAVEDISSAGVDGLVESYSRLETAAGEAIRDIERLRISPLTTATLTYKFEEDDWGNIEKKLKTKEFTDNVSKRTKEILKDYTSASKDLMKAQKEYYEAVNGGKASENTINKLSENVKTMEDNLSKVRNSVNDLSGYDDVIDQLVDSFDKLDKIRHNQSETDALKILDKADLEKANNLLKESKELINNISKDSIQLQKDMNAGYENTSKELEDRIKSQEQKLTKNISSLMNISNSKAAIDQLFSYQLEKAQKTQIEIARINDKANKTTGVKTVDEQDQYLKKYKDTLNKIKSIQKSLVKETNEEARASKIFDLDNALKELDKIEAKLNDVKSKVGTELVDKAMSDLNLTLYNTFSKTTAELDKVEEKISRLGKSSYANSGLVSSAENSIAELRSILNRGIGNLDTRDISDVLVRIEKLKTAAKDIDFNIKISKDSEKIETFIKGINERLEVLQSTANNIDISHITSQFRELTAGSDRNSVVMKSITDDVKNLERSLKTAGKTASNVGLNFRGFFDELGGSLRTFTLGEIIGDAITSALHQTWDVIKEMDAAMASLKKVADASDINTNDKLDSIRNQAIDVAKEVGMASSEVINAVADTLQAGIGNMQESIQVARSAMILANVGDMTQQVASEGLNTIINGYKLNPLKEIGVEVDGLAQKTTQLANAMDLINYAGNNFAIGTGGVIEAMKRGGTVLSEYGVSLQDSIGLITAANEAIQDPAKVGTALKTISINMSGVKAAAKDGSLELNKTAKALKTIGGIEIYSDKSKGQIKNMVEIFDELNQKIKENKLDQDEIRAISEALAGKDNAAVLQSLMGNYETFKQIQSEFSQGLHFGSAEKENSAYVDSLSGKLNHLKEVWIDTLMVLADSESVKGLVDLFISISEGINTFVKALDSVHATLPVLFGTISGGTSFFKTFNGSVDAAREAATQAGTEFGGIGNIIKTGAVPALKSFVKQGLLIGGITLAVQGATYAWDKLTNGVKDAAKELKAVEEEHISSISAQNEKVKILETTGVKYEELANKAKRTAAEEEEMLRLGNELAKILPEMVIGYDEENNAILSMTDDMQGLIDKTKDAAQQYERLLLGTRIEQSDTALKLLTKGEGAGKDGLGYYDQKKKVEEDYYSTMKGLQEDYQSYLEIASSTEGKKSQKALEEMRRIKNEMLTEESKYQTKYLEIQSNILEQSNIFRAEMDSTWKNSAAMLVDDVTPELEKGIKSLLNVLDFTEISSDQELESVRRIFRELPELAQSGTVDLEKLTSQLAEINKEFANTDNIQDYHTNMKELSKAISSETGWDANVLFEMFTKVTDGTLESAMGLEKFLEAFGKTKKQIKNGDSIAKELQVQFNEMESVLDEITRHDFNNPTANLALRIKLQNNEDLPQQVRDMVNKLTSSGVEDKYVVSITAELMMYLKDGKLDEQELNVLKNRLREQLELEMSEEEVEMTINGILNSFNTDEILKSIEDEIGKEEVTKEVTIKADDPKKLEVIQAAIDKLASRPNVDKAVRAVVEGDEDLVLFHEIIKNLPVNETYTNKFIIENAKALSELNSYKEVLDYINGLPDDVKKTYGLKTEGVTETAEKIEKIDQTISSVNQKELKVTSTNDDVLKTIEDVETLIKLSAKVEDGKYKLEIDANTQKAIDNINLFKDSINNLNKEIGTGKSISYHANTAQAAKNITGLKNRVNEIKKLTGKTFKYYSTTAQAAKNISGLIDRIDQINAKKGKTFTWHAETAQAAKNISGLINRIDQINGKQGKSLTYTTTVKTETVSEVAPPEFDATPVGDVADNIEGQTSRIRSGVSEINSITSTMSRATVKTPLAIAGSNIHDALKNSVELLQELYNRIDKVNNSISLLDKNMEKAVGEDKIKYLQQQNELYKDQANIQKELQDALIKQHNYYKYYLENKGFNFNSDGNLTNYEEKLIAMKKEEERLKKLADSANEKYNNYDGKDEKYKNSLKSAYEKAKENADKYSNSLSEIESFLDEYLKVTFSELPKAQEEWVSITNSIKDNEEAIKSLRREQELYTKNSKLKELDMLLDEINDKQDLLNSKISSSSGEEKNKYQEEYLKLLKEELKLQEEKIKQYEGSLSVFQKELSSYGAKFNESGTIQNLAEILNAKQGSEDLEYLNNLLEEYFAIQREALPDVKKEWESLRQEIDGAAESIKVVKEELTKLHENSGYKDHERDLAEAENKLAMNQVHLNNAVGKNYIEYLEERIDLTNKLKKETQDLLGYENSRRNNLMSNLSGYGFTFREDGSIPGYGGKIAALKESLSEEEFEKVFGMIEDYLDTTYEKIPDLQRKLEELGYSVEDYKDELEDLIRQRAIETHTNKIKELENEYDILADKLGLIDVKLKYAFGSEKIDLLDEQISLLEKQLSKQKDLINSYKSMASTQAYYLNEFGVKFDNNGDITNLEDVLNKYQDHRDIEKLKDLIDEYLDIQRDKLPDAVKEWESLSVAIKDTYKEQLNTAKEIEDKITEMYKKQIQDRISSMNKETDAKIKALQKQKDAYNEYRDDVDYNNEYNEKLDEINKLQKQLDVAMRDTSLSGQKKVAELQELLLKAQKELDKLTQSKIDNDVNDLFDNEIDRIEEANKQAIEKLEETWTDSKIAEMVSKALGSGVFIDIEGNVQNLEDALVNFAKETGELFGVMGSVIKSELITNLEIAKETVKDLSKILNELNLEKYVSLSYSLDVNMVNESRSIPVANSNPVQFNAPLLVVEGNVDSSVIEDLKKLSKDIEENVVRNIVGAIR